VHTEAISYEVEGTRDLGGLARRGAPTQRRSWPSTLGLDEVLRA
jgi:hypothetical protein